MELFNDPAPTLHQKIDAVDYAIAYLEDPHSQGNKGLCRLLRIACFKFKLSYTYQQIQDHFDLLQFKPRGIPRDQAWWMERNTHSRLKVLRTLKEQLHSQHLNNNNHEQSISSNVTTLSG